MDEHAQAREERFTELYDAHFSAVRAYAWRRDRDGADDVVAETFAIAWQRLDSVPAEALPWLIGVARNVRLNRERGERRRRERGERRRRERERQSARDDAVPSFLEALEAHSALADALGRLSPGDREILLLAAWERLDRAGLAAALDCSKAAASVRLFRARRRLAAALAAAEEPDDHPHMARPAEQLPTLSTERGGLLDEH